MVYYVDGYPALEKQDAHRIREERTIETIKTAQAAIENLNERVQQGTLQTKELFKNVNKNLLDVVLSQDSDFFAYDSVKILWRPVGKRDEVKIFEYSTAAVLLKTDLSSTKFTELACVSSNDCNKNFRIWGSPETTNRATLVQEYLESPIVIWRDQDDIDFTAPILVFTTMTQEIAVPVGTASDPPFTAQSDLPPMDHATLPMSFQVLCKEYESIKEQHAKIKAQKRMTSSGKR
ncbi:hypothetical protein KVV02_000674 [Mortierella alpina]|uniref:PIN domain-containing protein n=1 Tax=Mortierella alpina TaxID=64518 RepID=A0A9P8A1E6_MORAP|nr:hypothetical protein KVV02_000674 [Mortierella alpina]